MDVVRASRFTRSHHSLYIQTLQSAPLQRAGSQITHRKHRQSCYITAQAGQSRRRKAAGHCSPHRSRLQPAPLLPRTEGGAEPGPDGPRRLFCFGRSGGRTRREASRGARTSRRPRAPQGRPGAVRSAASQALPRSSAARSAHQPCASFVPAEQVQRRAGGSVVLMFLQLLLSTPFRVILS